MSSGAGVRGGRGGCLRVKAKLKAALQQGNYYEAHQMYRTLFYRLSSQENYEELLALLFEGAVLLHQRGQSGSGVDLTKCYLEILVKAKEKPREELFQKLVRLYCFIPLSSPEREDIMAQTLKWATAEGSPHGHPRLHQMLAYNLWNAKRFTESRHHFLYACDGIGCGSMLVEFQTARGFSREVDLFIASTVLQLICLKKHVEAAWALKTYTEKHPSIQRGPPYRHPLLNFIWLLLLTIENKHALPAFSTLVEKYKTSLDRDPSFFTYLEKISEAHFGLPPRQKPRPGGMFAGLFDSIFTTLNEDENENATRTTDRTRPQPPASNPLSALLEGLGGPATEATASRSTAPSSSNSRASRSKPMHMETEDLD